jgi:hypothetical protein
VIEIFAYRREKKRCGETMKISLQRFLFLVYIRFLFPNIARAFAFIQGHQELLQWGDFI